VLQQDVVATAAAVAMPASRQLTAAALPAAAAAAPATAVGRDDDAQNYSRQIHHQHDLTALDPTEVLSVTALRQTQRCRLLQNCSLQQSTEDAVASPTISFNSTLSHTPFNSHILGKSGLVGLFLDSQSTVILILSILTREAKIFFTHMVLRAVSYTLTLTPTSKGFEAEVFTRQMPFPLPNQQHHKH